MARSAPRSSTSAASRTSRVPTRAPRLTEQLIVETTLDIIGERGVEGLSMRLLSLRLGVALGATYTYVPNKRALLHLVANELDSRVDPHNELTDGFDQAKAVMLQIHDVFAGYPGMGAYVALHVPEFASESLVKMITDPLCRAGLTPAEANRITLALVLINVGHMLAQMPPELHKSAARALEDGVDLILEGARARLKKGRRSPRALPSQRS